MKVIKLEDRAYELETKASDRFKASHDFLIYGSDGMGIERALQNLEATYGPEKLRECMEFYFNQKLKKGA